MAHVPSSAITNPPLYPPFVLLFLIHLLHCCPYLLFSLSHSNPFTLPSLLAALEYIPFLSFLFSSCSFILVFDLLFCKFILYFSSSFFHLNWKHPHKLFHVSLTPSFLSFSLYSLVYLLLLYWCCSTMRRFFSFYPPPPTVHFCCDLSPFTSGCCFSLSYCMCIYIHIATLCLFSSLPL